MRSYKVGLYLGAAPEVGGTFQYNQSMLDAVSKLPKEKIEVIVIFSDNNWKPYVDQYDVSQCFLPRPPVSRFLSHSMRSFRMPFWFWRKLQNLFDPFANKMRGLGCDLFLFPSQDWLSYILDLPALGTIHDLMHRYEDRFPEIAGQKEKEARDRHYQAMCDWCLGILVDSQIGKKHVIESYGIAEEKIHVQPFTAPRYIFSKDSVSKLRNRYALPSKYVFYPAQFWEHKNHKGLIRAVAIAKKRLPDIQVVFVGSKKNGYESTKKLVEALGLEKVIHFMGYVPDGDMVSLYCGARAMIMPSFCGPTNIPPLEAFVTGCPVAVSNVYAMPEQVGDAALLFNPDSPKDIAEVVVKLWTDDECCRQLAQNGFKRALHFSPEMFAGNLSKTILTILSVS